MTNIFNSIYNIRLLDELSEKKTLIHSIHSLIKLMVTIGYIISILSFNKYEILGLVPFVFYLIITFNIAEIPYLPFLKRLLFIIPFVISIGIFNPIFDKNTLKIIFGITISAGFFSLFSLLIKCSLTVLAVFLLIATTGIENISSALRIIFIPKIFNIQIKQFNVSKNKLL